MLWDVQVACVCYHHTEEGIWNKKRLNRTSSRIYITLILLQLLLAINVLSIQIDEHLAERALLAILHPLEITEATTMNFFP